MANMILWLVCGKLRLTDGWLITVAMSATLFLPPLLAVLLSRRMFPPRVARNVARAALLWPLVIILSTLYYEVNSHRPRSLYQLLGIGDQPSLSLVQSRKQLPQAVNATNAPANGNTTSPVKIVIVSDTHQLHWDLEVPHGDILLHCGDFTNFGSLGEVQDFNAWLGTLPHKHKLVIPGNHDVIFDAEYWSVNWADWGDEESTHHDAVSTLGNATLLIDKSISILGLRIFGTSYVPSYAPWKTGFNVDVTDMADLWAAVLPDCADVLATHAAPYGMGDRGFGGENEGCEALRQHSEHVLQPQVHAFGHIHSEWGVEHSSNTLFVNAAAVTDFYTLRRTSPIVVDVFPSICI